MRKALLVGVSAAALGAAALVTAAPASAATTCPRGFACFYTGDAGTGRVLITQNETWQNLNGLDSVRSIFNNQAADDDACVASGLNGNGQRFCVDGGTIAPVPQSLLVRSLRG